MLPALIISSEHALDHRLLVHPCLLCPDLVPTLYLLPPPPLPRACPILVDGSLKKGSAKPKLNFAPLSEWPACDITSIHFQVMTFSSLGYKQKCYPQHRLVIFEFIQKSSQSRLYLLEKQWILPGMLGIALKFLLLRKGYSFIHDHGFYQVLAVFENKPPKGFCY